MNQILNYLSGNWLTLLAPFAVFIAVFLAGWLTGRILFRSLRAWTAHTATALDDILIHSLKRPVTLWVIMLAVYIAAHTSRLSPRHTAFVAKALLILWIVSLTIVAARLAGKLVRSYAGAVSHAMPVTSLTEHLAGMAVAAVGLLILLNTLGISITPILTALGVGGLAVALALQDTLSNLFAGFYVSLDGQVRLGDYIKLQSGEEGYVTDISWRCTTIRALANNLIIVPNAKLAQAIVTNYNLPEKRMSLSVPISVSYDSDPDFIEKILIEEALATAAQIPGLLSNPAPSVRFIPGFGASSLDFTLGCQVSEFVDQYLAQHELRKRIFRRFRKEGIEIPFPVRTLYVKNGPTPTQAFEQAAGR